MRAEGAYSYVQLGRAEQTFANIMFKPWMLLGVREVVSSARDFDRPNQVDRDAGSMTQLKLASADRQVGIAR